MHISRIPESSSTATSTSFTASRVSQPEPAIGQRQQGPFVGLSTTAHTPESALISETYHQQDGLGLLSEIDITQIAPFEALVTYITATFDDDDQGQSASSLSLSNESSRSQRSSQPVDDHVPIVREKQSPDPTDKWIMMSSDEKKPFKCGYEGCCRKYSEKAHLRTHFVTHTGDSKLRCYLGDCAGKVVYRDVRVLTRHTQAYHTFERPLGCEICGSRFRCADHLKSHMKHMHAFKAKKKSPKSQSVSKSFSATTTTHTASTSTNTFRVSEPELAAGQRQQGFFVDPPKTVYMPELTLIPATYYQQNEPRLLSDTSISDISSSQIDPFKILATHRTVTIEDQNQVQEQPDEFPLPFDELLQPLYDFDLMASEDPDDVNLSILPNKNNERISNRTTINIPEHEIMPPNNDDFRQALTGIVPEARLVGIIGDPKLPSSQHRAYQRPEPTDKWIILTDDKKKPFECGYEGCGKRYTRKNNLRLHFVKHTRDSPYKCYLGECNGRIAFPREQELIWHIHSHHTFQRPYQCEVCSRGFIRLDHLKNHRKNVHSIENEKKSPKRKKK